jgi:ribosomal protein S18 acetylase RimI-like enzyme
MKCIETKRLVILSADISDLEDLRQLEKECDLYFAFDPQCENNHSASIQDCLTVGDLPPGGTKENYYFYKIQQNNILIGFMAYYIGYPYKNIAYLSDFYIGSKYRRYGMGSEIVDAIADVFKPMGINEIRLCVSLRNATALQFWVKHKFDCITKVECTGNLTSDKFAGIELQRKLS